MSTSVGLASETILDIITGGDASRGGHHEIPFAVVERDANRAGQPV